jgi:hypothetical protein
MPIEQRDEEEPKFGTTLNISSRILVDILVTPQEVSPATRRY